MKFCGFYPKLGWQKGYTKRAGDRFGLYFFMIFFNYSGNYTGKIPTSIGIGWNRDLKYCLSWEIKPWRFTVWNGTLLWSVNNDRWTRENPHLHNN